MPSAPEPAASCTTLSTAFVGRLQQLANRHLGIEIRPGKELLVSLRAAKHMRELGIDDPELYFEKLEQSKSGDMLAGLLDLLTTNHTAFLREPAHFDFFRQSLVERWRTQSGVQRLWCAAASTGEEPYTIAMTIDDALGSQRASRIRILATDVSRRVLAAASRAVYTAQQVDSLPEAWRAKYFLRGAGPSAGLWKIRPELRERVSLRRLNLVHPLPPIGPFPVIFCRNVMIYFASETRRGVVERLASRLEPGGCLIVGHAESLSSADMAQATGRPGVAPLEEQMIYLQPGVYRKPYTGERT
jgi:chemotaxis protein methyltransferase CheR